LDKRTDILGTAAFLTEIDPSRGSAPSWRGTRHFSRTDGEGSGGSEFGCEEKHDFWRTFLPEGAFP